MAEKFDVWAVVELFGHQVIAGKVCEHEIAGKGFIRVDVPESNGLLGYSRLFGPDAIYSINPTTEEVVLAHCERNRKEPIQIWQLALPENTSPQNEEEIDF
ncbi:MAG: hypothetical protein JEZ06_00320 [Anaerolineaceae bacterium]|nr:hypothetical protein [Anaerolineaceae bacterium]